MCACLFSFLCLSLSLCHSLTCIALSLIFPPLVSSLALLALCAIGTTIDSGNGSASPASLRVTDQKLGQESQVVDVCKGSRSRQRIKKERKRARN